MKWDVARVEPLDEYKLRVELVDGRQGTFDMTPYLEKGVFQELKDPAYFRQVHPPEVRQDFGSAFQVQFAKTEVITEVSLQGGPSIRKDEGPTINEKNAGY